MSAVMRRLQCGIASAAAYGLVVAVAQPLAAQSVTTTGSIRGRVTDANGAMLSNADVVGRNVSTGLLRQARVGADGAYTLPLLPPGTYVVRVRALGFRMDSVMDVNVTTGQSPTINVTLSQQAVALEAVQVTSSARQAIDVTDASVVQNISRDEIEKLPSLGRDFTDFINLSGLVDPNPERTTGGQFSIAGLRPSQTSVQIDGVDANNSFFGENRGGSRIPFEFSLESIREFQIVTNGFDVEYGNYTGGVVNVVTRGGTNERQGSLYANYRGSQFTKKDFAGKPPADFNTTQYAAQLSGPIKHDKAFYFFSLDGQRRREPQLPLRPAYFLDKLDADGNPNPDSAGYANLVRFTNILHDKYGITDAASKYQSFQTTNDVITLFGRVDFNLNANHHLSLRENFADHTNDNLFDPGFDFSYGAARAENLGDRSSSLVGELESVVGKQSSNVLRFQFSYEDRPRNGHDLRPSLTVTDIGGGQKAGYGGTFVSLDNDLLERKVQVIDNFTHAVGRHVFKLGGNVIFSHLDNTFVGPTGSIDNTTGDYTFANLNDFEAMHPTSYTRSLTLDGSVPRATFNVGEYAIYAQDEWRTTPRLTTTIGVRYDLESFLNDPARVIDAERAFGLKSGNAPTDKNNISPRVALAYDVRGNGSSVARVGAGYFYGRLPYVVGGNVASSVKPVLSLACTGSVSTGADDAPPGLGDYSSWSAAGGSDPIACAGGVQGTGVPTYTFWQNNFQYPESFKANVGYDQLLDANSKLSLNVVGSRSYKLYTVRNINLRPAQFTLASEGGRQVFVPAATFNPSSATSTAINSSVNTDFSQVYVNYTDGQSQSLAATAELTHSFTRNTQFRVSYTYTTAYDNSSYTCCTAKEGFSNPTVGAYGPNDIGGVGDTEKAWGPSATVRNHVIVFSGNMSLPWGFRMSGVWRFQSGNRWGPEQGGDLNGDGVNFNDRPFIFAAADLPLTETDPIKAQDTRDRYAQYLKQYPCIAKYVGQIIPRNPCTQPWFNQMNMQFAKSVSTVRGQRAEVQVDLFNVLNGLNPKWGRYMGVFGANRDLLTPNSYDPTGNRILYSVPTTFGAQGVVGTNLLLQFQGQVGVRYYF